MFEFGSSREIREYKSTHNEAIFLLLLQRRYLHLHIKSDLDISRNKQFFSGLLNTMPNCHEAHFELGMVYFHIGNFKQAIEHMDAVRARKLTRRRLASTQTMETTICGRALLSSTCTTRQRNRARRRCFLRRLRRLCCARCGLNARTSLLYMRFLS